MFEMDKDKKIESMRPYVEKLIVYLNKNGIEFSWKDEDNDNVVLTRGDKIKKISYHCFYRYSGLSSFFTEDNSYKPKKSKDFKKSKNENDFDKTYKWIKVDDDMYINSYMRSIIDYVFNLR